MKECPECGSILADNEPYCENCGFDPDFDTGSWNHGSSNPYVRPYVPRKKTKKSKSQSNEEIISWIVIVFFILSLMMLFSYIF